ncbi:enoyl-CoA hydratase/isomerase family protein [Bordetella genomosp. 13]|uniref:enoyl-CoA hydratase/isomerase family protein n=1 Tax=Bordetella genomosp. 13 TaxID=463040 RepID=UPI0011A38B4F|nr:enoyl-CoA hydratase/isomerase family protein [Bordetella genomosp. 13]
MSTLVDVAADAQVTVITLNRPDKMNALSAELVEALIEAVDAAHAQGSDLIVFKGEGHNFSAGFDFGGYAEQSEGDLLLRFVRLETLLQKVAESPALTLALAHGKNFGAGVDLFGACMLRVAAPDATFRMPGLKFGLVLGTRRFAALVGTQVARDVLTHTRTFDAQAAHAMGFVTELAAPPDWPARQQQAQASARELSAETRRQLYQVLGPRTADADLASLVRSAAAPGLKQRIQAYLAK